MSKDLPDPAREEAEQREDEDDDQDDPEKAHYAPFVDYPSTTADGPIRLRQREESLDRGIHAEAVAQLDELGRCT